MNDKPKYAHYAVSHTCGQPYSPGSNKTLTHTYTLTYMHHSAISTSAIGWILRIYSCDSVHPNLCGVWNSLASNQKGLMTDFRFGYCTAHDIHIIWVFAMIRLFESMVLRQHCVSGNGTIVCSDKEVGSGQKNRTH